MHPQNKWKNTDEDQASLELLSCTEPHIYKKMKPILPIGVVISTLMVWFGLVSLFNGISTFEGYLMPKPFS